MAAGDVLAEGKNYISHQLLENAVATTDGVWVDVRNYLKYSLDISGITTATIQIRGSNAKLKPANTADGNQLSTDITANGFVSITQAVRWIKCKITAYANGTINAIVHSTL